jgi:hypothetical protein
MKATLTHADRNTDKYEAICRLYDYANANKNLIEQPRNKTFKGRFQLCWIIGVKKQSPFCYLPLGVLMDVCTPQLHVISSLQKPLSECRWIACWPATEISQQHLNVTVPQSGNIRLPFMCSVKHTLCLCTCIAIAMIDRNIISTIIHTHTHTHTHRYVILKFITPQFVVTQKPVMVANR